MKTEQVVIKSPADLAKASAFLSQASDLTLAFGAPSYFEKKEIFREIAAKSKHAIGCSTAGEISNNSVLDNALVVTKITFEKGTTMKVARSPFAGLADGVKAGQKLGEQLAHPDLRLVFVLGTGVNVNGSDLIRGIQEKVGPKTKITGGLAADQGAFTKTYTMLDGEVTSDTAMAIGFFGAALKVGYGSQGGWKPFGPARKVTKVEGNILFELDGEPALKVYETYLGEKAKELPGAGLLYPFAMVDNQNEENGLIRTILGIDKAKGSLTLAGDLANGTLLRLMHASTDGLVQGAEEAAKQTQKVGGSSEKGIAILVSCIGRKLVMGEDTEEELEAVQEILPEGAMFTGFYSNGEICALTKTDQPVLHNQTMTITYLTE